MRSRHPIIKTLQRLQWGMARCRLAACLLELAAVTAQVAGCGLRVAVYKTTEWRSGSGGYLCQLTDCGRPMPAVPLIPLSAAWHGAGIVVPAPLSQSRRLAIRGLARSPIRLDKQYTCRASKAVVRSTTQCSAHDGRAVPTIRSRCARRLSTVEHADDARHAISNASIDDGVTSVCALFDPKRALCCRQQSGTRNTGTTARPENGPPTLPRDRQTGRRQEEAGRRKEG